MEEEGASLSLRSRCLKNIHNMDKLNFFKEEGPRARCKPRSKVLISNQFLIV